MATAIFWPTQQTYQSRLIANLSNFYIFYLILNRFGLGAKRVVLNHSDFFPVGESRLLWYIQFGLLSSHVKLTRFHLHEAIYPKASLKMPICEHSGYRRVALNSSIRFLIALL